MSSWVDRSVTNQGGCREGRGQGGRGVRVFLAEAWWEADGELVKGEVLGHPIIPR